MFSGVISAGVSVPVQIPSQGPELTSNYWPRLQWSQLFGFPHRLLMPQENPTAHESTTTSATGSGDIAHNYSINAVEPLAHPLAMNMSASNPDTMPAQNVWTNVWSMLRYYNVRIWEPHIGTSSKKWWEYRWLAEILWERSSVWIKLWSTKHIYVRVTKFQIDNFNRKSKIYNEMCQKCNNFNYMTNITVMMTEQWLKFKKKYL